MSHTRVLLNGSNCQHCQAERLLEKVIENVEEVDRIIGDEIVGFLIPDSAMLVEDGFDQSEVSMHITIQPEPIGLDEDVPSHVITELRRIAHKLVGAAIRLEIVQREGGAV